MDDLIKIRCGSSTGRSAAKCILFERDERHPGGSVFVSDGPEWVEAYPTPGVLRRITEGGLIARPADTKRSGPKNDRPDVSDNPIYLEL